MSLFPYILDHTLIKDNNQGSESEIDGDKDELYNTAVEIIKSEGKA